MMKPISTALGTTELKSGNGIATKSELQSVANPAPSKQVIPADLFPLPLTPFEKLMWDDDRPDYPRIFTVVIEFEGELQQFAFEQAIREVIRRNPLLSAIVRKIRSKWHWVPAQFPDKHIGWGMPDREAEYAMMDLQKFPGFRVHGHTNGALSQIRLNFHHAVTDGRGVRRVALDWTTHYAAIVTPDAKIKPADFLDYHRLSRRGEIIHVEPPKQDTLIPVPKQSLSQRFQNIYEFLSQQPTVLRAVQARCGPKQRRPPHVLSYIFNSQDHDRFRNRIKGTRYNLNDVSVALLLNSIAKWNRAHGESGRDRLYRVLVPVNLREPGDELMPAGNRMSFVFITRPTSLCLDWPRLLPTIRAEMDYIDDHECKYNLVSALPMVQSVPGLMSIAKRLPICMSTAVLTNLGESMPRRFRTRFPEESGRPLIGNLRYIRARGAPPLRSQTRLGIGVSSSLGEFVIDGQMDSNVFTQLEAEDFLKLFTDNWKNWANETAEFRDPAEIS